jgi:hypothetical protein
MGKLTAEIEVTLETCATRPGAKKALCHFCHDSFTLKGVKGWKEVRVVVETIRTDCFRGNDIVWFYHPACHNAKEKAANADKQGNAGKDGERVVLKAEEGTGAGPAAGRRESVLGLPDVPASVPARQGGEGRPHSGPPVQGMRGEEAGGRGKVVGKACKCDAGLTEMVQVATLKDYGDSIGYVWWCGRCGRVCIERFGDWGSEDKWHEPESTNMGVEGK